jgi:hypothetical protein
MENRDIRIAMAEMRKEMLEKYANIHRILRPSREELEIKIKATRLEFQKISEQLLTLESTLQLHDQRDIEERVAKVRKRQ